ncbi:MAG: hypothetical protein QOE66_893 [Chloroflexota bacterium]|nr:hypothetical protein [Chloroflexota bacterium]
MSGAAPSPTPLPSSPHRQRRAWLAAGATVLVLAAALTAEVITTRPVRRAVTAYTALLDAANRQDLDAVRRLCTARYLAAHEPEPAREGGVVGLPRNIHKNFRAWRHGPNVWLCPTNRVGPLYQFVFEAGSWRFDGPVGILRGRGEVVPYADLIDDQSGSLGSSP